MASKLTPTPIPKVEPKPIDERVAPSAPTDDQFTGGLFVKTSDQEEYALCIHEPDSAERTHTLKNSIHFWQGTKEQFKAQFEKV